MIAKIAVSAAVFAIDKPYSYRIPASLAVRAGMLTPEELEQLRREDDEEEADGEEEDPEDKK